MTFKRAIHRKTASPLPGQPALSPIWPIQPDGTYRGQSQSSVCVAARRTHHSAGAARRHLGQRPRSGHQKQRAAEPISRRGPSVRRSLNGANPTTKAKRPQNPGQGRFRLSRHPTSFPLPSLEVPEANMAHLSAREKQAIINSLITAMALARHSLSPTQTKMATRSAGELLWLLNIPEFTAEGRTFSAAPPEGSVVDLEVTQRIATNSASRAAAPGSPPDATAPLSDHSRPCNEPGAAGTVVSSGVCGFHEFDESSSSCGETSPANDQKDVGHG